MSDLEDKLEQIKTALAELRASTADGPATRKQLDALFRQVHNVKAVAAADGLTDLSRAAHELENLLHSLRTGESTPDNHVLQQLVGALSETLLLPDEISSSLKTEEKHTLKQALREGAKLFLVQTSFDPSDFDQQFQNLKAILTRDGEVISVAPKVENDKINFRILYATRSQNLQLAPNVSIEPIVPKANLWNRILRAGKSTAASLGKDINFNLHGTDISLDDAIADCLIHLVRNAIHHGIESRGTITIAATNDKDQLKISVTDDGRGIDPQILASGIIFQPGYSTASEVSEISGRGVGLDVVKTTVEQRSGSVQIQSELNRGSTFTITIPKRSV
ncbi:MAG TPA: ATP-binding protein [Pyrinomonadaceae bacterium]|nr:ATP-binding protein [Pyrinomonadaceae bacterium]